MIAINPMFYQYIYHCFEVRTKCNLSTSPELCKMLAYSLKANCYHFLRDPLGNVCGYIIWANINEESVYQLDNHGISPIYPHEWSEGRNMLLIDIAVDPMFRINVSGQIRRLLRNNRENLHRQNGSFFTFLRKKAETNLI